jgi:hypothetical protein
MAFNAQEFRSRLADGGARPNLFEVKLTIPDSAAASEQISFVMEAASGPAYTLGFADTYYFGRRISNPADREWADFSGNVLQTESFDVRTALEDWQDRCSRTSWNTDHVERANGLPLYSDISLIAYSKEGEVIRETKMFNAFPILIGPLQYAWAENNQIQRFSVDLRYDYAEVVYQRNNRG